MHDELPNLTDDPGSPWSPQQQAVHAIGKGERKYGAVKAPTLVISSSPPACGSNCDSPAAKKHEALVTAFITAFRPATLTRILYVWRTPPIRFGAPTEPKLSRKWTPLWTV